MLSEMKRATLADFPRYKHHSFPNREVIKVADVVSATGFVETPCLQDMPTIHANFSVEIKHLRLVQEYVDVKIVRKYLKDGNYPPIRIMRNKHNSYTVLDGYHRLVAAMLNGHDTIFSIILLASPSK